MPSLSLIEDADPEDDSPSYLTRLSNRLLGDPRKAPRRLATLFVFGLFCVISLGAWLVMSSSVDTSGSSAPIMGPLLQVLTSVWVVPVLALWLTRSWLFFNRSRYANTAAEITGWTVETIKHLRDEVRTTDGCTRVIASTEDTQDDIADRIDVSLEGDRGDDTVAFWTPPTDASESTIDFEDIDELDDNNRREELLEREAELIETYNHKTEQIEDLLDDALGSDIEPANLFVAGEQASLYDLMDDESAAAVDEAQQLIDECEQLEADLEALRDELATLEDDTIDDHNAVFDDLVRGISGAWALDDELHEQGYERAEWQSAGEGTNTDESRSIRTRLRAIPGHLIGVPGGIVSIPGRLVGALRGIRSSDEGETDANDGFTDSNEPDERQIPWRIRFFEEMKHLWLDLQSGFRTGDVLVKFGVPATVTFVLQLFAIGLWTTVPVYLIFVATSTLVGLGWYWIVKRRRQRRLSHYRDSSSTDVWLDCAGQFKTVETADVTAYIGFIAGRRYASYDREEFVRKTSRTMYQHVSDECVSPSDLEHYARCLEQMKPNLQGYRENILETEIEREIKHTVENSEDDIIAKAELAWSVIEQPTTSRIERRLGHDPELVSEEYRFLVEDAHALDERDVEFADASGEVQRLTLVFPAEKSRLPDMSERHSQFSDRFSDRKGDPVYELPEVDPRDDLSGFIPTAEAAALFDGADPAAVSGGN